MAKEKAKAEDPINDAILDVEGRVLERVMKLITPELLTKRGWRVHAYREWEFIGAFRSEGDGSELELRVALEERRAAMLITTSKLKQLPGTGFEYIHIRPTVTLPSSEVLRRI